MLTILILCAAAASVVAWALAPLALRSGEHRRRRLPVAAVAFLAAFASAAIAAAPLPGAARAQAMAHGDGSGRYATLLFSRTEMTAAVACIPDDTGIARLDTAVAPWLASLGLAATGTLETGRIGETAELCTHGDSSLSASWGDAEALGQSYGWTFGSATAHYYGPAKLASLTPDQAYGETCGSAAAISAHGLPGASSIIAYPGKQKTSPAIEALQEQYGSQCFSWGRSYGHGGITPASAGGVAPYWQATAAVLGGACADVTLPCHGLVVQGTPGYTQPSAVITALAGMPANSWYTLQAYILVTGAGPGWDCTSPDPAQHWSTDVERYCYSDWQQIVSWLATSGITVTDPGTVGIAFGRPASFGGAR